MNLTIDVGNTNIVCGFFDDKKDNYELKHFFRMSTPQLTTTDEFSSNFNNLLKFHKLDSIRIKKAILSSVVPSINHNITKMMNLYFNLNIIELNQYHFEELSVNYDKPSDIGIDRLINLTASGKLYGRPSIVVDYGTAITVDVLSASNQFLGGLIIPGIHISLEALVSQTSNLPKIELDYPKQILGMSTKECMQNGLYYLNRLGIETIIKSLIEENFSIENRKKIQVIATGGLSNFMAEKSSVINHINSQLSLIGLKIMLERLS